MKNVFSYIKGFINGFIAVILMGVVLATWFGNDKDLTKLFTGALKNMDR